MTTSPTPTQAQREGAIEAYVVVGRTGHAYDDPKLSYAHADRELTEANERGTFKPYRIVTLRQVTP